MKFYLVVTAITVGAPLFAAAIIGGEPVKEGTFTEVLEVHARDATCSGTLVGPRTFLTAAHCASQPIATFKIGDRLYSAELVRNPEYPSKDHDIAVGIVTETVHDVMPATIAGQAKVGAKITMMGYGCTEKGGGGDIGTLRRGDSVIEKLDALYINSRQEGGAALCFGDAGGPAFVETAKGHLGLVGIASKGDIKERSYHFRLDRDVARDYLKAIAEERKLEICGINVACDSAAE